MMHALSAKALVRLQLLLLVVAVLVVFSPVLWGGFLWDDDRYVTRNPLVTGEEGFRRIWFSADAKDYYPVLYSLFRIQWALFGMHPFGYHLLQVLQHAVNVLLLWWILRKIRVPWAWFAAMLFALHPLNVESVAWITEQKNTLLMLFFLLSVWAWMRDEERGGFCWIGLSWLFFVLSLLSKPGMIAWPLLLPLWICLRKGRLQRMDWVRIVPFLAASVIVAFITVWFQQAHSIQDTVVGPGSLWARLAVAGRALLFYAGKYVWPAGLCTLYLRWEIEPLSWQSFLPLVVLVLVMLVMLRHLKSWGRPWLLGTGFAVVMMLPVLGFVDVGFFFYAWVADRWMYVALPGLTAATAWTVAWWLKQYPAARRIIYALCGGILVVFAVESAWLSSFYRSNRVLFTRAVACTPEAWAGHTILGNAALGRNDLNAAQAHFEKAVTVNPEYWEAYNGLGVVFASRGQFDQAIIMFKRVVALNPDDPFGERNLQTALRDKQQAEKQQDAIGNEDN